MIHTSKSMIRKIFGRYSKHNKMLLRLAILKWDTFYNLGLNCNECGFFSKEFNNIVIILYLTPYFGRVRLFLKKQLGLKYQKIDIFEFLFQIKSIYSELSRREFLFGAHIIDIFAICLCYLEWYGYQSKALG